MLESLMNWLNYSQSSDPSRTFQSILLALILSSIFSWFIAWIYTIIRRESGHSQSFVQTLVMLSVIVTAVMAIIGNDLARAFGLVGAVSIIRFRTRVKDPLDMAFLFLVITIGMANGLRLYTLSFLTTLFVSFLIFMMRQMRFGQESQKGKKETNKDGTGKKIRKGLAVGLGLVILSQSVEAKEKLKFEGYVSSGFKYIRENVYGSSYYHGKLKVETELDKYYKAVLDLRGRSETDEVELKRAYIRIIYSPWIRVKVGQIKKQFTSEEMVSKADLLTIEPSLLNRHMEPFGYVVSGNGAIVYRKYKGEGTPLSYQAGIYYNESRHTYAVLRCDTYNGGFFHRLGIGGIYRYFTGTGQKAVMAFSLDGQQRIGRLTTEIEVVWGQDPIESHYRTLEGLSSKAAFWSGRLMLIYRHPFQQLHLTALEPVVLFSFLAPDAAQSKVHQIQFLIGLNIYLHKKVRIRLNGDLILSNNALDTNTYSSSGTKLIAEVQTRW